MKESQKAMNLTKIPRHITYILFLLLFNFISENKVEASHVVGSDLTYECVPGAPPGTFLIRLVLFRDCAGANICTGSCNSACSKTIQIVGADPPCNGTSFGSITLNLINVRDVQPVPECPTAKSTCTNMGCVTAGTFTPAIERYEFTAQINFSTMGISASCCNINLVWQECCRNGAITTGSAGQNFYTKCTINRCLSSNPCNGSPTFFNDPWSYVCKGQPFIYNNGALDYDLDSLSFAFVPALQANLTPVSYTPPFSYTAPMPYTGLATDPFPNGIHCDSLNGDVKFTIPQNSPDVTGVVAVEVTQWKRINNVPTIIGKVRRDIQLIALTCAPNNSPILKTLPSMTNNEPKTNWEVGVGQQLCFDIIAHDSDINDTTKIYWTANLINLGVTFTPNYNPATRVLNGPRNDSVKVCWTPDSTRGADKPYYFNIHARDNRCPTIGHNTRSFSIRVFPSPNVTLQKIYSSCELLNGKVTMSYVIPATGPEQFFAFSRYTISSQPFDYGFVQNPLVYDSVQTTPQLQFNQPGKYLVRLELTSKGPGGTIGSSKTYYDTITINNLYSVTTNDTNICKGSSLVITAAANGGSSPYSYRWYHTIADSSGQALNAPNFTNPNLSVTPAATKKYYVQVRDLQGCRKWDSVLVTVHKIPSGVLPDSVRLCAGESYTLNPGNDSNRVVSFLWSTGDTTQTISRNDSNNYIVKLTNSIGCIGYDTLKLRVNAPVAANAGNDMTICKNASVTLSGSGGQLYEWKNITGNTIVSAKSANRNITVGPTNTSAPTYYELTTYYGYPNAAPGHKECTNKDTVIVTVNPLPVLTRPSTTKVCRSSDTATLGDFIADIPGGTGVWTYKKPGALLSTNPLNVLVDSLANIPQTDTIRTFDNWIVYTYTTAQNCTTKDSALVTIYGNPPVNSGPILLWCENAGVYAITTSNQKYSPSSPSNSDVQEEWTGNGIYHTINGLTRQHFFDPLASGVLKLPLSNIQQYKYTHIYNPSIPSLRLACINSDTVLFRVTPIPTANAGNDITVCKDDGSFAISTRSGATSSMSGSYWAPENVSIKAAMTDSATFNPASPAVPNPSIPPTNDVYKLYYINTASGCMVKDSLMLYVKAKPAIGSVSGPSLITNDTLIYTYTLPNQTQHQYIWQVNSGTVSGRSDSSVVSVRWQIPSNTAKGKLKAAITNSLGCTDSAEMEISRLVQPVGMQNLQSLNGFDVYPNPNNGRFVITTEMKSQAMVSFSMTDMLGKQVWNDQQLYQQGLQQMEMNITLPSGVYLLQVSDGSGKVTKKLVVQ